MPGQLAGPAAALPPHVEVPAGRDSAAHNKQLIAAAFTSAPTAMGHELLATMKRETWEEQQKGGKSTQGPATMLSALQGAAKQTWDSASPIIWI
eukprot:4466912-Pyramimonas_sp.AAC.2